MNWPVGSADLQGAAVNRSSAAVGNGKTPFKRLVSHGSKELTYSSGEGVPHGQDRQDRASRDAARDSMVFGSQGSGGSSNSSNGRADEFEDTGLNGEKVVS